MAATTERARILAKSRAARELPPPHICRRIRERAALSVRDLAGALEVSQSAVWFWETGQRRPVGENLTNYVELLDELQGVAR